MRWAASVAVLLAAACSGTRESGTPSGFGTADAPGSALADAAPPEDAPPTTARPDALPATDTPPEAPDTVGPDAAPDAAGTGDAAPVTTCGNGVLDPGEACDPGPAGASWCDAGCGALVDVSVSASFGGHRSFGTLPTSNGFAVATYTLFGDGGAPRRRLDRLLEHPYAAYDAGVPTRDFLYDGYFGYHGGWLVDVAPDEVGYAPGTGIIRSVQHAEGLRFERWSFVPFHGGAERLLVALCRVTNESGLPVTAGRVVSLWNLHLGGEGDSALERVAWRPAAGALVEWRGDVVAAYRSLVAGSTFTADNGGDPNNPFALVLSGAPYAGYVEPEESDDIVVGFQDSLTLAPGASTVVGVVVALGVGVPEAAVLSQVESFVAGRGPEAILQAELAWWEAWHAPEAPPASAGAVERAVYRQSTAVLKMAQVRESAASGCPSDRCAGQLLAALVPGVWHIAWVRDACYAIVALARSGHTEEAAAGIRFLLRAEMRREGGQNHYQATYIESDDPTAGIWGLGVPLSDDYAISVARYFGRGLEESDANAAGPNIEWDGWGLFLWALSEVVAAGQEALLAEAWPIASVRVADLLLDLVDPATGLLQPDSSIWERHWCPHGACSEPETRTHHTSSTLAGALGLRRAAALATRVGDSERSTRYAGASDGLLAAVRTHLSAAVPGTPLPALAGNLEELAFPTYFLDAAVVEAVAWGLVPAGSPLAFGSVAALDLFLPVGPHSPGYVRSDDPTWYDAQEWVVMDLRAAGALARMGQGGRARSLVAWIAAQAAENFLLIPELLSDGTYQPGSEDERFAPGLDAGGDYQGAVPMIGFGAGAFVLAVEDVFGAGPARP